MSCWRLRLLLQADYLPAQFTAEDYPNLIAAGQRIDTVAAWVPRVNRNQLHSK